MMDIANIKNMMTHRKGIYILAFLLAFFLSISFLTSYKMKQALDVNAGLYMSKTSDPSVMYYNYSEKSPNWPNISARAAVLIEMSTGTILYAKNEHERRDPASVTKIMTALVALERGDLSSNVIVSNEATKISGSSIGLRAGEEHKLEELIRSTMLKSGNDGTLAIAEHIAGSVSKFVEMMNDRAKIIGLKNTHFLNPHGLTKDGHYSSAYDLALLSQIALSNPKFKEIVSTEEIWYEDTDDDSNWFRNTNKLIGAFHGADGVKTGTTTRAGNCLAASATRDGVQFIVVVLHSSSRWSDAAKLLEYGFSEFTRMNFGYGGKSVYETQILYGKSKKPFEISGALGSDIDFVVRKVDMDKLDTQMTTLSDVKLPIKKGDVIGYLTVTCDGVLLLKRPLYSEKDIKKPSMWDVLF